ncbi:Dna-Directed Rna polymerase Iii Subunit Rpc2 [Manis pentadactyla]|nr:Dna-Directed Rna polymerase Iii Subunit Rpc2 [Manis pentadactyla]
MRDFLGSEANVPNTTVTIKSPTAFPRADSRHRLEARLGEEPSDGGGAFVVPQLHLQIPLQDARTPPEAHDSPV